MIVLDLTLRVEIRREILINRRVLAVRAPPEREEPGRGWEIGRSRRAASGRANPLRPLLQLPASLGLRRSRLPWCDPNMVLVCISLNFDNRARASNGCLPPRADLRCGYQASDFIR